MQEITLAPTDSTYVGGGTVILEKEDKKAYYGRPKNCTLVLTYPKEAWKVVSNGK